MDEMNFNTDFNAASALLDVGIKQIETENDLFLQEMALAMEYSEEAYNQAHKAHNKRLNAATQTAIAEGVQAGASFAGGATSFGGGFRMNSQRSATLNQQLIKEGPSQPNAQGQQARSSIDSQDSRPSVGSQQSRSSVSTDSTRSRSPAISLDSSPNNGPVADNQPRRPNQQDGQANPQDGVNDPAAPTTREAVGGSPEFKEQFNTLEGRIVQLREQKAQLGAENVEVGQHVGNNQAHQPNVPNQKSLSEVSTAEYDGWKTRRDYLQQEVANGNDPGGANTTEMNQLKNNIDNYDQYHRADVQIEGARGRQKDLEFAERNKLMNQAQMETNIRQMKWGGGSEMVKGIVGMIASPIKLEATSTGVEADRKNTEAEWSRERASAMRSLAEQSLSNSKSPQQYIAEAFQTTQSAIQRLSNVQA